MNDLVIQNLTYLDWGPFSLEVAGGQCVALTGPSGSGKTLLLRAVADLDCHGGEIRLGDTPAFSVPGPAWRRLVGFLPADPQWWHQTVGEHFPGSTAEAPGTARPTPLLESLGFDDRVLTWDVGRLSAGEKQRLALARLLVRHPHALLLDEPSANLDESNRRRMEDVLAEYRKSRAVPVLCVTHDLDQASRMASRRLELVHRTLQRKETP